MSSQNLERLLSDLNEKYANKTRADFRQPEFKPERYYLDIASSAYFQAVIDLRHALKLGIDAYWSESMGATNVDLYMMTPSISSPMGPGSDSEAVEIQFGPHKTYLTDSAQFGFEPILLNDFEKVYCYLPSIRGEDHDSRHLNQFFHCEAEIIGPLEKLIPDIESFVRELARTMLSIPNLLQTISDDYTLTKDKLSAISGADFFEQYEFSDAIAMLRETGRSGLFVDTEYGADLTSEGEIVFMQLLSAKRPIWLKGYVRDRVPFYLKPNPLNSNTVINADLLFPPLRKESFGGEIVGAGQRQDSVEEIYDSLRRQRISSESYEWYIDLRRQGGYQTTSGFGLGIERFIAWALNKGDIKDVIPYPRLKGVNSTP